MTIHTDPDPDPARPAVTVLGLGAMGAALATSFVRHGHPTTVWNRTPSRAAALVGQGAAMARSAADAIEASPLVVVCVSDYDAASGLLKPLAAELAGRVVVNLSSGSSADARTMAGWVAAQGAGYLDGAILAGPDGVVAHEGLILYSGPRAVFEAHQSTLERVAGRAAYLGADPGLSALHDVAVLAMMWAILNGFLHGAALLKTAGIDAAAFTPIVRSGVETTAGWLEAYAAQVDSGEHPGDDATLATHVAAMQHLLDESEAAGVSTVLPAMFKELGDRGIAAGHAEAGYTALIELFLTEPWV